MGILDGIVEWIAEQVMNGLDLVTTSVLGALGCDMTVFLRYFSRGGNHVSRICGAVYRPDPAESGLAAL